MDMEIKTTNVTTLKDWLQNEDVVLVDVREPFEHEAVNIENSHLIPLATITRNKLPECQGKKLVIYCRSGKRSHEACHMLLAEDPELDIYNLEGGILAWSKE